MRPTVTYEVTDAANDSQRRSSATARVGVIGFPLAPPAPFGTRDDGQVRLTWGAAQPNGSPVTEYVVETSQGLRKVSPSNALVFDGLTNGTPYQFRVAARNRAVERDDQLQWSAFSNELTPDVVPGTPAMPQLAFGDRRIAVTWTAPLVLGTAISTYQVRISGQSVNETREVGLVNQYDWAGLVNGQSRHLLGPGPERRRFRASGARSPTTPSTRSRRPCRVDPDIEASASRQRRHPGRLGAGHVGDADRQRRPQLHLRGLGQPGARPAHHHPQRIGSQRRGRRPAQRGRLHVHGRGLEQGRERRAGVVVTGHPGRRGSGQRGAGRAGDGRAFVTVDAGANNGAPIESYEVSANGGNWAPLATDTSRTGTVTRPTAPPTGTGSGPATWSAAPTPAPRRTR